MTIADLQSTDCFQGWIIMPRRGPRLALTPRERQVLNAALEGRTHKEIAFDLGIADGTVRVLYARAMKKLGWTRTCRVRGRPRPDM